MTAVDEAVRRELVRPLAPLVLELSAAVAKGDVSPRVVDAVFELRRATAKLVEPRYRTPVVDLYLPITTVCEVNAARKSSWRVRYKRGEQQRSHVYLATLACVRRLARKPLPCTVFLTRIAPRKLDAGDNYPSALKYVRDAVAMALGVDDGGDVVEWEYLPGRKGAPNENAVQIQIIDRKEGA